MSSSSLISNIQFETALLDVFANSNREDKKAGYWNGVPLQ